MKFCPQCGTQLDDAAAVCPNCGNSFAPAEPQPQQVPPVAPEPAPQPVYQQPIYQQPVYQQPVYQQPVAPVIPAYDHTAEFDAEDISNNKVFAMAVYLLGTIGIIIALLASHESKYAGFHVRNGLKFSVTVTICAFACIIPILGWIAFGVAVGIIAVLRIICFFQVCKGKAVEPAIIRGLGFLK